MRRFLALIFGLFSLLALVPFTGVSAQSGTNSCFCTIPSNEGTYGACSGKTTFKGAVSTVTECQNLCVAATLTYFNIFPDYNSATTCHWRFDHGSCSGPDPSQAANNSKCKDELASWLNSDGQSGCAGDKSARLGHLTYAPYR
jgi:hypothetical protein